MVGGAVSQRKLAFRKRMSMRKSQQHLLWTRSISPSPNLVMTAKLFVCYNLCLNAAPIVMAK